MQRHVEQRHVDVAALARGLGPHQARQQPDHAGHARHEVDHRHAEPRRRVFRLAGQAHQAGFRLHEIVVARPGGALVVAAIGRDMQADHAWVDRFQAGIIEPELFRLVAAQIVDDGVGGSRQPAKGRLPRFRLQVERDAFLVGAPALEILAVIIAQQVGANAPARIAAGSGVLDLDDVGAKIGQEHGSVRRGAELLQRQHPQALQRLHCTGFRLMSCLAMMILCISLVPSPMHMSGASR